MHPLTALSLMKLNEQVAQNERTLFTFLSTPDGLIQHFIRNNCGDYELATVDLVYDYFHTSIRETSYDPLLRELVSLASHVLLDAEEELHLHRVEDEINLHINPFLGPVRLQELRPQQVQIAVNTLVQQGKDPATVRKAHAILHAALRRAVIDQLIRHNPSDYTVLPKMERRDIRYLTATEQKRFIEHLPDCSTGRALYFILGTGIRAGELSGLRWSDVQDDRFTIRQTVRRNRDFSEDAITRTKLEYGTPKSNAGHRTIPLTTRMQKLIEAQRREQTALCQAKGEAWNDNDLVFCTEIGTPYEIRNLDRFLHRTLEKAGLHAMGVHSLRHPYVKLKTYVCYQPKSNVHCKNRSHLSSVSRQAHRAPFLNAIVLQ